MQKKEIEVFSEQVDNGVVRMPGRNILGSVMQGDSLFLLHADLMDILESHKHEPDSELFYRIYTISSDVEERLNHYMAVCEKEGVDLNFNIELSVEDYSDLV